MAKQAQSAANLKWRLSNINQKRRSHPLLAPFSGGMEHRGGEMTFLTRVSPVRLAAGLGFLAVAAVALAAAPDTQAQPAAKPFVTVGDLQASCETDSPSSTLFCLGIIEGVAGSNAMYQAFDFIPADWRICPDALDSQQMRGIFIDWANSNAGEYERPAVYGVAVALRDASPCAPLPVGG